jgi:F420-0:gamma-glutamyl ligase-like protein
MESVGGAERRGIWKKMKDGILRLIFGHFFDTIHVAQPLSLITRHTSFKIMTVKAIKTHKITTEDKNILDIIDRYITTLSEGAILIVTSKIVAICEGSVTPIDSISKEELVISQADKYLPKETNTFGLIVTIKDSILAVNAGIDESNIENQYVLWPKNAQESANTIQHHLKEKFGLKNVAYPDSAVRFRVILKYGSLRIPIWDDVNRFCINATEADLAYYCAPVVIPFGVNLFSENATK